MWFKNITTYRLLNNDITFDNLIEAVENNLSKPIGKHDIKVVGWSTVSNELEDLVLKTMGAFLLRLKIEEKVVPGSAVKERLDAELKKRFQATGEKLKKDEKEAIKDAIYADLISKALSKTTYISGYIDIKNELVVVDTSSENASHEFLMFLRDGLGELETEIVEPPFDSVQLMTSWLSQGSADAPFELGMDCVLKDQVDSSTIRASKSDLSSDDINRHLRSGKLCEELSLNWHDRIDFSMNSKFQIKKIKFREVVTNQIVEDLGESDDAYSVMLSSMEIMVEDLAEVISDLLSMKN